MKENFNPSSISKQELECPYESKIVVCAACGAAYNVDFGCITIGKKVFGGRCDECGHTIGKKIGK